MDRRLAAVDMQDLAGRRQRKTLRRHGGGCPASWPANADRSCSCSCPGGSRIELADFEPLEPAKAGACRTPASKLLRLD